MTIAIDKGETKVLEPISKGWRSIKLGEICEFKNGINFTSGQKGRGVLTVDVLNMYSSSLQASMEDLYRVDTNVKPEYLLRQNDILFVRSSVKQEGVGWATLFHGHSEQVTFCGFLIRARLVTEEVEPSFLIYYLRSESTRNWIISRSTTGTITNINQESLGELFIPLPPLAEQKRIVAILNEQMAAVEKARAATLAQLEAAKALPAAYLRQVFDSPEAQRWDRKRLGDICNRITDGTHQPPVFTSNGIPFIFVRNIVSGKIDFSFTNFVSLKTYEELTKRCCPEYGDLLYSAVGSFGVAVVIETTEPFTFQRHIAHLKIKKEEIFPYFIALYINSPQGYKQSNECALGGAQRTVTLKSLSNFQIPIPQIDRQKEIAAFLLEKLAKAEKLQRSLQDQLDAIDKLPAAILRQAFNGEL